MMDFEQAVSEGFICPLCKYDLGSVDLLHLHFDTVHSQHSDAKSQGFTDKLQSSFLKLIGENEQQQPNATTSKTIDGGKIWNGIIPTPSPRALQLTQQNLVGKTRSHTREFRKMRQLRLNDCNIKLSRLEKLCDPSAPYEHDARRMYEKQVVGWTDDDLVRNCPECGIRFGVSLPLVHADGPDVRGRHHCRLCGYVFCSDCCVFLTIAEARRIVQRELEQHRDFKDIKGRFGSVSSYTDPRHESISNKSSWFKKLRRISLLNNPPPDEINEKAVDDSDQLHFREPSVTFTGGLDPRLLLPKRYSSQDEIELRLCFFCKDLLESRWKYLQEKRDPNFPIQTYNDIQNLFREINPEALQFIAMADSIYAGETKYALEDAKDRRIQLKMKFEKLGELGKALELWSISEDEPKGSRSRTYQLCRAVHNHVRHYLQENMIPLRSLPSLEQYERLKRQREEYLRRSQEAHAVHLQQLQRIQRQKDRTSQMVQPSRDTGFAPRGNNTTKQQSTNPFDAETRQTTANNDIEMLRTALEQQIDNVRNFLQQAKDMGRAEEVKTLQENLHDLKMELSRLDNR